MLTQQENELLTRIEGDAPMGRLMRANYWLPFALSAHLVHGDGPMPVRLLGENFVAFRAEDGRIGFLDELCPHRQTSLLLARVEGNGVRCIYHGWKIDVSGCVVEAPTQTIRGEQFAARVPVRRFPTHEAGGLAWVWIGGGAIVLPGVSIGDDAIVGAGSVVTRNVPPGTTVVGNPARVSRSRRVQAPSCSCASSPAR